MTTENDNVGNVFNVDEGIDTLIDSVCGTIEEEEIKESVSQFSRSQVDAMLIELTERYMELNMRLDLVNRTIEHLETASNGDLGEVAESLNSYDQQDQETIRREKAREEGEN